MSEVTRSESSGTAGARVVVLLSGAGSLLQALIDAASDPGYGAQIVAVGADRAGVLGLDRAEQAGIPTFVERVGDHTDRDAWDEALSAQVAGYEPDLVVSAGFLKLVGPAFLSRFGGRYLNSHNALLPAFPGIHGPRDALAYGVKVAGATLFVVDEGTDTGAIVAQCVVPVLEDDTEDTLTERIKAAERPQLVDYVGRLAREGFTVSGRKVTIGVNASAPSNTPTPQQSSPEQDGSRPIRRALVSVYDKTGLDGLARGLHEAGVQIVSTGGSAKAIAALGIPVTRVEDLTGFPECLDGRVKTLHPIVHAGILADSRREDHLRQLELLEVEPFDLVVCNLYPFVDTVASGAGIDESVEQIDIGGPTMVRAAAKNYPTVAIVTDPTGYDEVVQAASGAGFTLAQRAALAGAAFRHTATYDVQVASWISNVVTDISADDEGTATGFPSWVGATWDRAEVLRYGENPHQSAALYRDGFAPSPGIAQAEQLGGKAMSYNNYIDADAAWRAAHDQGEMPAVAIIKHANPCGIAIGDQIEDAYRQAHACDPVSAYGGIVAANRTVTAAMARDLAPVFTEVVLAPEFESEALEILTAKKNLRVLVVPPPRRGGAETRPISGGLLMQRTDVIDAPGDDPANWTLAAGAPADEQTLADLAFAWRAVRAVKSNAILLAADGASVGVGMGQVNRVDSCRLAVERAGDRASGAVAASDAFFPFADGLQILLGAGVRAVVSPGGSIRDEEVVAAATQAGATLYFTGTRHFAH